MLTYSLGGDLARFSKCRRTCHKEKMEEFIDNMWKYIKDNEKAEYKIHYEEIRNILGFDIDHSFLKYKKELLEYGYEITKISIKEKYVLIHKIESGIQ